MFRLRLDPYILLLLTTVAVASLLPARGIVAVECTHVTTLAIGLLFFLYGARLSTRAALAGLRQAVAWPGVGVHIPGFPGAGVDLSRISARCVDAVPLVLLWMLGPSHVRGHVPTTGDSCTPTWRRRRRIPFSRVSTCKG